MQTFFSDDDYRKYIALMADSCRRYEVANHLLAAARYIERNPVRAGFVREPWSYKWSSAGAHARGADDELVWVDPLLEMVNDWGGFIGEEITGEEMERFRQHERTGRPMGDMDFIEGIEKSSCRVLRPKKPGIDQRAGFPELSGVGLSPDTAFSSH
jgi:hypothetical protein